MILHAVLRRHEGFKGVTIHAAWMLFDELTLVLIFVAGLAAFFPSLVSGQVRVGIPSRKGTTRRAGTMTVLAFGFLVRLVEAESGQGMLLARHAL